MVRGALLSPHSRVSRFFGVLVAGAVLIVPMACRTAGPPVPETDEDPLAAEGWVVEVPEPPPIESGMAPPPGPYAPGFDALHYDIVLQLPDTGSFIRGMTSVHILLESPRSDTLALDFSGLRVESVDANAEPLLFLHEDGRLLAPVPPLLQAGDTLRVEVTYSGHPDDGLIVGRNMHGAPSAFADNWPNRARFWFPSIDHPSDKATVRFTVNAGASRQVIANGALREDGEDSSVWVWENDEPIPTYTMVIGAANFAVDEVGTVCTDGGSCTEVTTWLFPPDTAAAAPIFRRAAEMVAYYNRLIAPFPYEKLAHVQSSTRFGGMENVTAIFYPESSLAAGQDIELTVAHETAHQWFGDAVTEADWNHLWLSEGFASYFGALYFEEADGVDRFQEIMDGYRSTYLRSAAAYAPIVDPAQTNLFALLNANNYQKGAWVLHMLRRELGDEDFFEGIRAFYREHEHGTALTDDLRRALEGVSGRDLLGFFQQWVHAPGFPQIEVTWSWSAEDGAADVRVAQVQPEEWPAFEMPLEIMFSTPGGPVRHVVHVSGRATTTRFLLESEPVALEIDPDGNVLTQVLGVDRVHEP